MDLSIADIKILENRRDFLPLINYLNYYPDGLVSIDDMLIQDEAVNALVKLKE